MTEKRSKEIKLRLTPDEYQRLLHRKTTPHLAQWIRETCLADTSLQIKPPPKADTDLLIELARLTGSVNQLHIKLNSSPTISPFRSKKEHQALLVSIEQSLQELCTHFIHQPTKKRQTSC